MAGVSPPAAASHFATSHPEFSAICGARGVGIESGRGIGANRHDSAAIFALGMGQASPS